MKLHEDFIAQQGAKVDAQLVAASRTRSPPEGSSTDRFLLRASRVARFFGATQLADHLQIKAICRRWTRL